MNLLSGIKYNLRGLSLGLKTPKLLLLGIIRFMVVIIITILSAGLILAYHQEILNLMWHKPESQWFIWLWYLLSWLLSSGFSRLCDCFVLPGFSNSFQCFHHGSDVQNYRENSDGQCPGDE
jgi:hypothetical protein